MSDSTSYATPEDQFGRDALNAEKAKLLGLMVAGTITADEAVERLRAVIRRRYARRCEPDTT